LSVERQKGTHCQSFIYIQLHPDLHPNDPSKHEKFVALNEAYSTLSKSLSRREYDRKLAASSPPGGRVYQQGGGRRASGPSGMYSDQPPPGTPFGAAGPDPFASHSYPRGKQKPFSPE
jgi:curved DNA-binding protein CbpA